uniref:Uncharacterized protein n=1 Tax=Microbacterium sp. MA1 TaxID=614068 RepID=C3UMX2_9MICO|nr:hypothetical protein [Microbacterium sp. MA1]
MLLHARSEVPGAHHTCPIEQPALLAEAGFRRHAAVIEEA